MATTRLMPLHTGKGRTVGQAISAIIDYTENPQKTDGGRLITSWQCDSRIADAEFPPVFRHVALNCALQSHHVLKREPTSENASFRRRLVYAAIMAAVAIAV